MGKQFELPTFDDYVSDRVQKCRHFNGMTNKECRAGVEYATVRVYHEPPGTGMSCPCLLKYAKVPCHCEKASYPTREEAEVEQRQQDEEVDKMIENIGTAREAIIFDIKRLGAMRKDVRGVISCPICKGTDTLHYTRAGSYNGHFHAQCKTPGCIQWGE